MYLHIGGNFVVSLNQVVAIFNFDNILEESKQLLKKAQPGKKIIEINNKNPVKTCIITSDNIYLSSVATCTLVRRIEELGK